MSMAKVARPETEELRHLHVLVPSRVRDELAAIAEAEERSIGSATRRLLGEALDQRRTEDER